MKSLVFKIYTDGSCLGNPGPGGWGALIFVNEREMILAGNAPATTNNRMEMQAIIASLNYLRENYPPALLKNTKINIYSDSNLLIQTLNLGWKRKANLDLWSELDRARDPLNISWNWVKAHAHNPHNNKADQIAQAEAFEAKKNMEN